MQSVKEWLQVQPTSSNFLEGVTKSFTGNIFGGSDAEGKDQNTKA